VFEGWKKKEEKDPAPRPTLKLLKPHEQRAWLPIQLRGSTFVRPKWGIYRSLNNPSYLRDEAVLFQYFCLAKGTDDCN
jgi:hypothetical protein